MTTDEYGDQEIGLGVMATIRGVHFFIKDPATGETRRLFRVEPEHARQVAQSLTLRSWECEAAREAEKKSDGG